MTKKKLFTPAEANRTLPLVKRVVSDILAAGARMRELAEKLGAKGDGDPEVIRLFRQLEELLKELEDIGCFYRDWNFSVGLVDFPGMIDGKEVVLCWKSDEEDLKYYHAVDAGFSGRKLIPKKHLS